jgi:uncharacterized membrane protein YgcG
VRILYLVYGMVVILFTTCSSSTGSNSRGWSSGSSYGSGGGWSSGGGSHK